MLPSIAGNTLVIAPEVDLVYAVKLTAALLSRGIHPLTFSTTPSIFIVCIAVAVASLSAVLFRSTQKRHTRVEVRRAHSLWCARSECSVLGNAHGNDRWAPNGRPGHYNDADMLEIGNGALTVAEQRSHFALWCVMKSPLIIGADARALSGDSLKILKNTRLIAVNQDALGVQGTLRVAMSVDQMSSQAQSTRSALHRKTDVVAAVVPATPGTPAVSDTMLPWMARCTFGENVTEPQQWQLTANGRGLTDMSKQVCLTRSATSHLVDVAPCIGSVRSHSSTLQHWDFGRALITSSQVRDPLNATSCLAFNGTRLHMEPCRTETSDDPTPSDCATSRCRFSSLTDQLWYLNSLKQFSAAYTNFGGGVPPGAQPRATPENTPMCLSAVPSPAPVNPPSPPASINVSAPLQVWAGPLSGGDVVVLLLNTGSSNNTITAHWSDIGIAAGVVARAMDLWTGADLGLWQSDRIAADVASHDTAAFRLTPMTPHAH
eukprot:m.128482 g.128482  ORF g.128482 m.128482 type:complete len:489 (+) comp17429_c0_seq15:1291-2757(+)